MVKIIAKVLIQFLVFVIWLFPANILIAACESHAPIQELNKAFPNSVRIELNDNRTIEFCPDNTFDMFTATKEFSLENLKDFAFLYIYFFSDYYVLEEWRSREGVRVLARQILSNLAYKGCKGDTERESALCILRQLSEKGQVKLFEVRYDEKVRVVISKNINEVAVKAFPE